MEETIDIITPTYGNEQYTVKCFASIRKYTKHPYRIVWVDNGSSKKSREIVMREITKHKNYLTIWLPENTGFVTASNIGLFNSTGKYVCLLNNDTEVTKNWLSGLKSFLEKNNNAAAIGPVTRRCASWQSSDRGVKRYIPDILDLESIADNKLSDTLWKKYKNKCINISKITNGGMVAFFCTLFRRDYFEKIGFLPTVYKLGLGDDDETCAKFYFQLHKDVLFTPSVFIHHHHRTTFKTLFKANELQRMQKQNIGLFLDRLEDIKNG